MPKDIPHDLQFLGSQFSTAAKEIKKPANTKGEEKEHQSCPYHYHIFQNFTAVSATHKNLDILERYILEDPANQYAIFYQIETEHPSTSRDCKCHLMRDFQF